MLADQARLGNADAWDSGEHAESATEIEGGFAWGWARNIWADALG